MMNEREKVQAVRRILDTHGRLTVEARLIRQNDDLFAKGLTGLAAVDVLLALEPIFGVTVPSTMMSRRNVGSIDAILGCLRTLLPQPLAA